MNEITHSIGSWYDQNKRDLPWRQTHDPYRIWLSEIILQQTRVAQGLDYYLRFVEAFPDVEALAQAPEDRVLKLWQGLGYYSRARNLHKAAQQVVERQRDGHVRFPTQYEELIGLKGVGPYTAAAIASFSADEEVAVVDGNVYRVLSRLFDLDVPIDTGKGQHLFQELANELLQEEVNENHGCSSHHNQAMMEFGALHCTPTSPLCSDCPVAGHCMALAHGTIGQRPVKQGKVKIRERHLLYIIYIYKDTLWVHQRGSGDIWQGLWEFFLVEDGDIENLGELGSLENLGVCNLGKIKHQLTHQTLYAEFRVVRLPDDIDPQKEKSIQSLPKDFRQVTWMEWQQLAVPRLIDEANKKLTGWFGNDRPHVEP